MDARNYTARLQAIRRLSANLEIRSFANPGLASDSILKRLQTSDSFSAYVGGSARRASHGGQTMPDIDATKPIDADGELFRDATRDVRPIDNPRANLAKPKPKAAAAFARAERHAVLQESMDPVTDPAQLETGDEVSFRRPGVPESTLRKLRRGQFSIAEEIDLHGLTSPQARSALRDFIAEQVLRGARCVRVIHGKGKGSGPRGPVLKNVVNVCLRRMDAVVAFGSARPLDGGSGAVYVLLRAQ